MSDFLHTLAHLFGPFALALALGCIAFVIWDHLRHARRRGR